MQSFYNHVSSRRGALGIGIVALALSAGMVLQPAAAANCQKIDTVRFAFTDPSIAVTVAPYSSVPISMGWFKEECIKFEMQPVNGATAGIQAVATGNADVSLSGVPGFYPYMGKDPGAFKMIYFYNNIYEIAVPRESKIKTVEDLRGKTIGALNITSSGSYYYARAIVANAKISPDSDVKWLPTGLGAQAAEAYRSGKIQAFGLWDSVNAEIISGILNKEVRTLPSELNNLPAGGGFVTSTKLINEKRDVLVRFLRATYKGMVWAKAHPREAVLMHWQVYPVSGPKDPSKKEAKLELDTAILQTRLHTIYPSEDGMLGYASPTSVQTYADDLYEFGVLKQKIDTAQYTDMSLTVEANVDLNRDMIRKEKWENAKK